MGLLDEELACTVKILTAPMKGANGVHLFGLRARPRAVDLPGTDPEVAREKTSEDVDAGWPHHQDLRNR